MFGNVWVKIGKKNPRSKAEAFSHGFSGCHVWSLQVQHAVQLEVKFGSLRDDGTTWPTERGGWFGQPVGQFWLYDVVCAFQIQSHCELTRKPLWLLTPDLRKNHWAWPVPRRYHACCQLLTDFYYSALCLGLPEESPGHPGSTSEDRASSAKSCLGNHKTAPKWSFSSYLCIFMIIYVSPHAWISYVCKERIRSSSSFYTHSGALFLSRQGCNLFFKGFGFSVRSMSPHRRWTSLRHRQGDPLGFFGAPWGPSGVIPEELEEAADAKDKKKADGKGFTSRPTEGLGSDVIFLFGRSFCRMCSWDERGFCGGQEVLQFLSLFGAFWWSNGLKLSWWHCGTVGQKDDKKKKDPKAEEAKTGSKPLQPGDD